MADAFERSDGEIAAVLRELFLSGLPLGLLGGERPARKFKDPMHYVVTGVRWPTTAPPITNNCRSSWINRMGEAVLATRRPTAIRSRGRHGPAPGR